MNVIIIFWLIAALVAMAIAKEKGRNPYLWLGLGFAFGFFAVIAIAVLPSLAKEISSPTQSTLPKANPKPSRSGYSPDDLI